MLCRLKHAVYRANYCQLADVQVPKRTQNNTRNRATSSSTPELYHLWTLDRDEENGRVKIRYIGYSVKFDEWRKEEDIVNLGVDYSSSEEMSPFSCQSTQLPMVTKFCLFEELGFRIKSFLCSNQKADPSFTASDKCSYFSWELIIGIT